MCSLDPFAQENLKSALTERFNDKIYSTFKENVSNINQDSISKTLPKVQAHKQEIAKFVHEVNVKYGIPLDYNVLDISEVPHWTERFQVLVKTNIQQEAQPMQALAPNFSAPPLHVHVELSHQLAEINRLTQVMQQWSAKGLHQYDQPPATDNQDRFNTSTGRCRSVRLHSTPNMLLVPKKRTSRCFSKLEQQRYGYHEEGFDITVAKSQTKGGICMLLKLCQTILIMILLLLY